MIFTPTRLPGAFLVEPEPHEDERGVFLRTWCAREFAAHGLVAELAQCSVSVSRRAGTVRGLHFQRAPAEEEKLVRCTRGAIWDVIVDLRRQSPAFRQWQAFELTAESYRALYVPKGFAHGFQTLAPDTEVSYQISAFYTPEAADGLRYDDPALAIPWPLPVSVVSQRDRSWPDLAALLAPSP
ncbi:MAG TPA: dTDP-4-dehydrorhamnose 3,5-epimerase [Stellaceae bacterium]|nr:dTDP-4-dehydrorhamnose 3,5-epimerase [Stellaceae bacterium]